MFKKRILEFNEFFYNPKTIICFKVISDECNRAIDIWRKTGTTYSHIKKILNKLQEYELIILHNKEHRERIITLTEEGKEIQKKLVEIDTLLK